MSAAAPLPDRLVRAVDRRGGCASIDSLWGSFVVRDDVYPEDFFGAVEDAVEADLLTRLGECVRRVET